MNLKLTDVLPAGTLAWADIFNTTAFFNLHKTNSSVFLSVYNEDTLVAVCHFTETEPGVYKSPYRGTYGGINFTPDADLATIYAAVDLVLDYFKNKNAKRLVVLQPPFSHNLHHAAGVFNALLSHKFKIKNQDINHTLPVENVPLVDKMMRNNKKRLRKCERENFVFTKATTAAEFETVYKIIETNRKQKSYFVSMTFEQIMAMYEVFPGDMHFFKVSQNDVDAASALCIRLNAEVLYVFYWGDLAGFEQYSPIAFLADNLYEFAKANNFKLIDAGTSSLEGVPNFGVATFKENLGFTASPKLTYYYDYEQ